MSEPVKPAAFISKTRLDALTDGVYAFAMTLLVVNIELPDGFAPKSNQDLLAALAGLADTLTAYVITFLVLGAFWLGRAQAKGPEAASPAYAWAAILHLFPVTFMPFSMLVVGRYDYPAAVWLYAANMILLALSAMVLLLLGGTRTARERLPDGTVELGMLIASALLSVVVAEISPGNAMFAYLLNFATPLVAPAIYRR